MSNDVKAITEKSIRRQAVRKDNNRFIMALAMMTEGKSNTDIVERLLSEAGFQAGSGKALSEKSLKGFTSKCRCMYNAYHDLGKPGAVWQNMQRLKSGKDVLESCTYKSYVRSGSIVLNYLNQ